MKKILVINSKNRKNYNTTKSGSFKISFDNPIVSTSGPIDISLCAITIPKSFYNISINSSNSTFSVDMQGDAVYSFDVDDGTYTLSSLCTALQTALNNFDASYTDFTVTLSSSSVTIASVANNFKIVDKELAKILGFYNLSSSSYALSKASNGTPQFISQSPYLFLDIAQFEKNIYDSENKSISSFLIPLLGSTLEQLDMTDVYLNKMDLDSVNIPLYCLNGILKELDINLYNSNNEVVDLNGADWHFVLSLDDQKI